MNGIDIKDINYVTEAMKSEYKEKINQLVDAKSLTGENERLKNLIISLHENIFVVDEVAKELRAVLFSKRE